MIQVATSHQSSDLDEVKYQTKKISDVEIWKLEFTSALSKLQMVGHSYLSFYEEGTGIIYIVDTYQYTLKSKISIDVKLDYDDSYFIDSQVKCVLVSWRDDRMFNSKLISIDKNHQIRAFENLRIIGVQDKCFFGLGKGRLLNSDYIQPSIYKFNFQGDTLQMFKPTVHQYCFYSYLNNIIIYQKQINQLRILSNSGKSMRIHLNNIQLAEVKQSSFSKKQLIIKQAGQAQYIYYVRNPHSVKIIKKVSCYLKDSYKFDIQSKLMIYQNGFSRKGFTLQLKMESLQYADRMLTNFRGARINYNTLSIFSL